MRPDIDNLIVNITCYDKHRKAINCFSNAMIELKCMLGYINKKRLLYFNIFYNTKIRMCW